MFAKIAAILAHINVNTIHNIHTVISGIPPIAKCDTAPVRAVNVIINTLVPTAVLSSYPRTEVSISSIIIPPPAPMKPHIKPTNTPHTTDCMARFLADTPSMASFVVMTGFTMNLIPSRKVINTEKFPIVADGTRLDT